MGRTSKLFTIKYFDVKPDIAVLSKLLGSRLSILAVVGRREILDKIHVGIVGDTFGVTRIMWCCIRNNRNYKKESWM